MDTQLETRPTDTGRRGLPPIPSQAVVVAVATLEGLLGRRGLHQLRPWMGAAAFLHLVAHVDAGTFCHSRLGQLRLQMPSPCAVEASSRISVGQRWLVCTIRLDRADRWRCSEVTVLGRLPG